MNKNEFLNEMEKRLSMLEAQEREDMLSEYAQHIELKMESGMSEKEAIDDFGDIDSLTAEILEAYHIDPSYRGAMRGKDGEGIGTKAGSVLNKSKQSFSSFMEQQKEKQEKRMEQKQREDQDKPPRWKMAETGAALKTGSQEAGKKIVRKTGDILRMVCAFCLKVVLALIMIPAVFMSLLSLFGLGVLAILLVQGYPLAGVTLIALGCVLGFGAFGLFILTFIVKERKWEYDGEKKQSGQQKQHH